MTSQEPGNRRGPVCRSDGPKRRWGSRRWNTPCCLRGFSPCALPLPPSGTPHAMATLAALPGRRRPMRLTAEFATSLRSEDMGQASVEAAVLVPVVMIVFALLLQPACLLYTRTVMQQAAAEGARVLATAAPSAEASCEAYVRRRLAAVPNVAAFHVGGDQGWEIELGGDESSDEVSVCVEGRLRPLPLMGVLATMLGEVCGDEVIVRVEVSREARPAWLRGGYGDWVQMWR